MNLVFVNGEMAEQVNARIAVTDRGFRFGDGIFETIRVEQGVPYLWEYHSERLQEGLKATRIALPSWDIRENSKALLKRNKVNSGILRIAVSRGSGSEGYMPTAANSSLVIECLPLPTTPPAPKLHLSTLRRPNADDSPTQYKLAQGLIQTLALLEAKDNGCDNAVMLSSNGLVSECTNANLFWLVNNTWHTPDITTGCIAGVTRRRVMELIDVTSVEATPNMLKEAEALLLSNTRYGLLAATSFQDRYYQSYPAVHKLIQVMNTDRDHYTAQHKQAWL